MDRAQRDQTLQPLNLPRPIAVESRRGWPLALQDAQGAMVPVTVVDRWVIDEEWWRQPIVRHYFAVVTDDGGRQTIFLDAVAGRWYAQEY